MTYLVLRGNRDVLTDPYGNVLTVGTSVAFNLSGQVAIGEITEIKKSVRYNRVRYVLSVLRKSVFINEKTAPKVSKVHSENVCVIR